MYKRGQLGMFVIVALVLVAAIILFFLVSQNQIPGISIGQEFEPVPFLESCFRDSLRDTIAIMLPQGGFVNPTDFKIYQDTKVTYLCKNINYYEPCVMQYPLYLGTLKNEIIENLRDEVESCFLLTEDELEQRSYSVSGSDNININPVLKPGAIELVVERDFSFTRGEISRIFSSFSVSLNSPTYDLASVALLIASQEAEYCHFEHSGYMNLYPRWDIKKWTMSDSTKIYTIKDKNSGAEMNIAIRGCAIPAGF